MNLTKENSGRSMIEMLGVLAIIAVLTVVGIEGFGKAMQKWKSNLQRQAIVELVATAIKIKPNLNPKSATYDNITSVIYAMGDLPEGTSYKNGYIYDKEGNYFRVSYGQDGNDFRFVIYFYFAAQASSLTPTMQEACRNVILALQPVANEVKEVHLTQSDSTTSVGYSWRTFYTQSTLATATLSDIHSQCSQAIENGEARYFAILLNPY